MYSFQSEQVINLHAILT